MVIWIISFYFVYTMILEKEQLFELLKKCDHVPKEIEVARKQGKELFALIEGENFADTLIKKIEHIESAQKAEARKKYSRDIQDYFERLFRPISNVFNSTGGEKSYNIKNENLKASILKRVSRLSDNKSITKWIQDNWVPLFHADPNGVIFMEYNAEKDKVYPTYKTISSIRKYKPKGQLVDYIVFEPYDDDGKRYWRVVDDLNDYTVIQEGQTYTIDEDQTFQHPFGEVPAIINSNIVKIGDCEYRVSPANKVLALSKEYARDQSIKTLYKFLHGMPKEWRYVTQCHSCRGTAKKGDKDCPDCDGRGYLAKNDVTDLITLPIPKDNNQPVVAPNIAGHITPDLETWEEYRKEGVLLEEMTHRTFWGTTYGLSDSGSGQKTAEEVRYNLQPMVNRLDNYTDVAEWIEWQLTMWVAKYEDPAFEVNEENNISIHYGRRYILSSPDDILRMYNLAREKGDPSVILDRLLNEFITAKYKNNPRDLRVNLLKSKVEPYVHMSIKDVFDIFGSVEAQKKNLFGKWWEMEADTKKQPQELIEEYNIWFNANNNIQQEPTQQV